MANTKLKCYCSNCGGLTNHESLASFRDKIDTLELYWDCTYHIVRCLGCDEVSFCSVTYDENNIEYDENGVETIPPVIETFPERVGTISPIDSWYIPEEVAGIYKETISSLNNKNYRLAAVGFRAVIEAICLHESIMGRTLETKINALRKQGVITQLDRDRLHSIRFIGNDSIHEMKCPDKHQLDIVLEIVHTMINNIYILSAKCKDALEGPIKDYSEFQKILDEGISKRHVSETDTLKNLLPPTRRLIKEDIPMFEAELINAINSKTYDKLSLCPTPSAGRRQQYKIERNS